MTNYNIIASHFSETRNKNWPEFKDFTDRVKKGTRVLDLGCGNGRLLNLLKGKQINYFGIDNSEKLLEIAKKNHPNSKFFLADITKDSTYKNIGKFDYIFCLAVFHHLTSKKDQENTIKQIKKHLKKNGTLFLTTWNLWQAKYLKTHFKQRKNKIISIPYFLSDGIKPTRKIDRILYSYTKKELKDLIKKQNFKIKDIYYTKKGKKTNFLIGYNLCLIARI
ncbi:hypothetical protein COT75_00710 [Candidatus Beckwithbacteria bacterium CG10_big_fil_rev_8_21_14_0_10_34_10]|uniref:Uncharacterized protein n=1 Tax=Candidatus Beckwithbacteria bacterium CG10_big_fil_rev_8_21_14_0_10_34_10 TaxID=1974495 RepID=A0A2H0WAM1_9BACT|nr:MAG: hypothetical protein COT75_00710 [Candidatus Beckwithbacteria bacterium CG10_big_fil_rev_8_21_14_0_10_34_10]